MPAVLRTSGDAEYMGTVPPGTALNSGDSPRSVSSAYAASRRSTAAVADARGPAGRGAAGGRTEHLRRGCAVVRYETPEYSEANHVLEYHDHLHEGSGSGGDLLICRFIGLFWRRVLD